MLPEWIDWRCIQTHTNTLTHTHLVAKLLYLRCGCTERIEIFCLPAGSRWNGISFNVSRIFYWCDIETVDEREAIVFIVDAWPSGCWRVHAPAHIHTATQHSCTRTHLYVRYRRNVSATGSYRGRHLQPGAPNTTNSRAAPVFRIVSFQLLCKFYFTSPFLPFPHAGTCETMGTEPTYFPIEATLSFAFSCDTGH